MFRKVNVRKVKLIDDEDNIVYNGKLTGMPLREELILEKCIEYFNDKSPCYIHKSATMKRLFLQLEKYFEQDKKKNSWMFNELSDEIKSIIKQENNDIKMVEYSIGK